MDSLDVLIRKAEDIVKGRETVENQDDFKKLYEQATKMEPHEALRLVMQADTDEERKFFNYIANMNVQRRQKEVIERNLF